MPGDLPQLWGMLFDQLPEDMLGRRGEPSRAEWAIYTAITLYALHQQGRDPQQASMHREGISLGKAAAMLVWEEGEEARERIAHASTRWRWPAIWKRLRTICGGWCSCCARRTLGWIIPCWRPISIGFSLRSGRRPSA